MAVIDELITRYIPRMDPAAVRNVQRGFKQIQVSSKRLRADLAHVGRGMATMLGAVGVASVGVGMKAERSFTKLRTQLELSNAEIEEGKARARELSRETGVALDELANAFFSLRSAGLAQADALDAMGAAAKAGAIDLGNVQDIALLAGGALNVFGSDTLTAEKAVAQMLETVRAGNIKDVGALSQQMPQLLSTAGQLGVEFKELGAEIAGYTRTGLDVPRVTTGIKAAMNKLLAPTEQGKKLIADEEEGLGMSTVELRDMADQDGLLETVIHVTESLRMDDGRIDTEKLKKIFESEEAIGFALDVGANQDAYRGILADMPEDAENLARAMAAVRKSGWFVWVETINNLKTDLIWFYEKAIKPLLRGFNLLPDAIKRVVIAFAAFQAVTMIGPLKGMSLGLWGTVTAMGAASGTARALALRHTLLGRVILRTKGLIWGFFSVLGGMFKLATWRNLITGAGRALVGLGTGAGRALVGLGPRIAGLAVSLKTFSGVAGLGSAAVKGIATALLGIPGPGWILALIVALTLLYMKSEGFRKLVNGLVKWVLALVIYGFELAKNKCIEFMDWLSGKVPDWVKKLGGWFGDLFGGIDDRFAEAGARSELNVKGLQEKTERRRRLRRIEAGEEEWSQDEQVLLNMLRDPVTPPLILPPGAGLAAVQAAADGASYTMHMDVGGVTVQAADASDGKQVGQDVSAELDRMLPALMGLRLSEDLRNAVEDNDTGRSE